MRLCLSLLHNETLKLLRRRRPQFVLAILTLFLGIATWAQAQQRANAQRDAPPRDWRVAAEQRIEGLERRANRRRIFASVSRFSRFEATRLRYHLQHDIDPGQATGPLSARGFAGIASALLLPLLITVLAADLVTGEASAGTIKLLLTRPVARWKILLSKLAVMAVFATLLVAAAALLSWAFAGLVYGWRGWRAPVFSGFRVGADGSDLSSVRMVPLWLDTLAAYGLAWYATLAAGTVAVAFSVFFRSSVAAMGALIAVLVAGVLLGQMTSDWEPARWSFPANLPLPQFYSGVPPPVAGMTLGHSVAVLAGWSALAFGVALAVFSRRDVKA